ncbi:MAG: 5-oxoprolinase subunit PxpB [Alphaproteobacteria bacterium]|nr:5-oxoprolinase subunit PxpB [Alphaproteobacteria bacterium]
MVGQEPDREFTPVFLPAGDTGLVVQYGDTVDAAVNRQVRGLAAAVTGLDLPGVVDLVPTLRSLLVHYDPLVVSHAELVRAITPLALRRHTTGLSGRRWRIPVCYEDDCAPDLPLVAELAGLDPAEVVRRHTATEFEVFMMGFLPGFPYLGMLPKEFDLPRRSNPRIRVPPGSISVAARQTTVYTLASPGGWHLIGRTPVRFYDPGREHPILVRAGDLVMFEPVPMARYRELNAWPEGHEIRPEDGR